METIQISSKTSALLGQVNALPKEKLGALCRYFLQCLVTGASSVAIDDEHESILCALSTLLLEATRVRAAPEQLKAILTESSVSDEYADILSELYSQHQDTLIAHIETTGIAAPAIVGLDWRLDYSVRSKHGGRENAPMFFVSLRVKDRGVLKDIDMIATREEVQDLLSSVRDAVKQVERLVQGGLDEA